MCAMAAPWHVCSISLFSLLVLIHSCGINKPITTTIPLSPFTNHKTSSDDKWKSTLSYLSTASLIRDRHIDFSRGGFSLICPKFRPLRRRPLFPRRPNTFPRHLPKNPRPTYKPRDPPPSDPFSPSNRLRAYWSKIRQSWVEWLKEAEKKETNGRNVREKLKREKLKRWGKMGGVH
jgi:hypothetical protein